MLNPAPSQPPSPSTLTCRACGHAHHVVALRRGERALCSRCRTVLARRGWFGAHAALAFSLTGLALALPAALLPFVTVSKLHREHVTYLFTGVSALWQEGMPVLAIWVFLCGTLAPFLLVACLFGVLLPPGTFAPASGDRILRRAAHALEHWAMPEVHVLAVLVSMIKLGSIVNVTIGAGFWCYVALSFTVLIAWRSYDLDPATVRIGAPAPALPAR
jgi:paraquat-inducible protein A